MAIARRRADPDEPWGYGAAERPLATSSPARYAWSAAIVGLATLTAFFMMFSHVELANLVMVYLLGIIFVAYRLGRGPSILASLLSVAVFDFCFVPPYLTFAVADARYLLTFTVMLVVGLVVGTLTDRVRGQADAARAREDRTAALYGLTRELATSGGDTQLARVAAGQIEALFGGKAAILLADAAGQHEAGQLRRTPAGIPGFELDERELSLATCAYERDERVGRATSTRPDALGTYLPLRASSHPIGVLAVMPADVRRIEDPEQLQLLETFAQQTAMALERSRLAQQAQAAHLRAEREEVYSSLLSSVSHDLRTPLAAITGAASTLLEDELGTAQVRRDLLQTIFEEADRLNRLVGNLLDMTRLESGSVTLRKEWTPLEEVVGTALNRLDRTLCKRQVHVRLPESLPLIPMDGPLMGQVFLNLLENAGKYTPESSPIEIAAAAEGNLVAVEVADRGPGLPPGSEVQIFDKFFRAPRDRRAAGTGLGLAICRAIVVAHGGTIAAENRPGGGAVFRMKLPLDGAPPEIPSEEAMASTTDDGTDTPGTDEPMSRAEDVVR